MYLNSFSITGYQSYRATPDLRLDPHITILAGRNNVGKTALLRALRLPVELKPGIGEDLRLQFAWTVTRAELFAAFTNFGDALRTVGISSPRDSYELCATVVQRLDLDKLPHMERFSAISYQLGDHLFLLESNIANTGLRIGPTIVDTPSYHGQAIWWRDLDVPGGGYWETLAQEWMALIRNNVLTSYYIQPRRTGAQPVQYNVVYQLEPDGSNLTTVTATLYNNCQRTIFRELETFMRSAFPEIHHIDIRTAGSPAIVTVHVVYGEGPEELAVPLEQCGTGVEQMLMLAVAILTATTPRLFLIDEPHAFLHPSAERSLLRFIRAHPQHQYVIATHSAVFLNSLPLAQARLITIDGAGSHINDVRHAAEVLTAVGVTAADLWSADALFWIEGPSDVRAMEELINGTPELVLQQHLRERVA